MKSSKLALLTVLLLLPGVLRAQFFLSGSNPASVKWSTFSSDHYKMIHPVGTDSLARVYMQSLEKWRVPVGASLGYEPVELSWGKVPVILHAYDVRSNGMVVWAPRRLEVYGTPNAYNPEAMPWTDMLAIHEQRHVAQMQFSYDNCLKPITVLLGEMFPGLCAGLYPGPMFLEGDAVMAETALSRSGRGRTASFLNYYKIAFDNGDFRDWRIWIGGSQLKYEPNYYTLGYLSMSGIRYYYGCPDYSAKYWKQASRTPWNIVLRASITKNVTGMDFYDTFNALARKYAADWKKEIQSRAPFVPYTDVVGIPHRYTTYKFNTFSDSKLYSIRSSIVKCPELVVQEVDGRERAVAAFSSQTSQLAEYGGRIWWSENINDPRWEMKCLSHIRYMDLSGGKKHTLNRSGRYFNPAVSEDGLRLSVTEYTLEGRSRITVLDSESGEVVSVSPIPDSLQIVQTAWAGGRIYATAISECGFGIYCLGDSLECVLPPQPVSVKDFCSYEDMLMFTCDRTGADELYVFNPSFHSLQQMTSSRYGGSNYKFSPDGKWLYYSADTYEGKILRRSSRDSLLFRDADFSEYCSYPVADCLAEQDRKMIEKKNLTDSVQLSETRRYSKAGHAFNVHSWAPFYFNPDNIMNMTYDHVYDLVSAGALVLFQNTLSTLSTTAGYAFHKDPYGEGPFRHTGHLKVHYAGLYPEFEAQLDFNDRDARLFSKDDSRSIGKSYLKTLLSVYVPLNFNSGGWNRGFVPKLALSSGNDRYSISENDTEGIHVHTALASVRGFIMRPTAVSGMYPRWGIGAEAGVYSNLGQSLYDYFYVYGYVPGIIPSHGIKLSARLLNRVDKGTLFASNPVRTAPRGFKITEGMRQFTKSCLLTADYALPFSFGDFTLWKGLCQIRRFEFTPFTDVCFVPGGNLGTSGFNLACQMGAICWISIDFNVGINCFYNWGSSFDLMKGCKHWSFGPTVSFDF